MLFLSLLRLFDVYYPQARWCYDVSTISSSSQILWSFTLIEQFLSPFLCCSLVSIPYNLQTQISRTKQGGLVAWRKHVFICVKVVDDLCPLCQCIWRPWDVVRPPYRSFLYSSSLITSSLLFYAQETCFSLRCFRGQREGSRGPFLYLSFVSRELRSDLLP